VARVATGWQQQLFEVWLDEMMWAEQWLLGERLLDECAF